jgi:hypothetical protein
MKETHAMKHIFEHITRRAAEYAQQPIFVYLRDREIDCRKRLEFVPWLAHFVMTFADMHRVFTVEDPTPGDRFQELVNAHFAEEDDHWRWFLADLETMRLNPLLRFTDALRILWSVETSRTRALAYEVCKLAAASSSLEKLVLLHGIEATGRVALETLAPVASELEATSGEKLVYVGPHHLDTERRHKVEETSTHSYLQNVVIEPAQTQRLCALIDELFAHFSAFAHEAYERATSPRTFTDMVEACGRRSVA